MDNINNNLNKAVIAGFVILLAGAATWLYSSQKQEKPAPIKTSADIVEAVTAPEIEAGSSPVANKVPEVNPIDLANPFKEAYKNPFE